MDSAMRAQHVAFREMATVGGHDLRDSASEYIAGAAFHLNRRPRRNLRHEVGGCDVWLKAENPIVVVATRKPPIDDFVADCRAAALQALDVASFVALDALGIPWADENYYHWLRTDTAETRLTVLSAVPFGVRTQLAGTVIPADPGATPPSSPTLPDWDPAFRFFRLSQTADDVFEAYRNLYLAFEATMSTVAAGAQSPSITSSRPAWLRSLGAHIAGVELPPAPRMGERRWLKAALRGLESSIDFAAFVSDGDGKPVNRFIREQYDACRCALFHSKARRTSLLPGDPHDRTQVAIATDHLARFVMALWRQHFGITTQTGALTTVGFELIVQSAIHSGLTIGISDDDSPSERRGATPSPKGLPITTLPTGYAGSQDEGRAHLFAGEIPLSTTHPIKFQSIATSLDPRGPFPIPGAEDSFRTRCAIAPVDTTGIDVLAVWHARVLENAQLPRTRFPY
jgi:hypothetical protein